MDNADFKIMGEAGFSCEIADKGCAEGSDLVAVEEAEARFRVDEVVDQAISISVKRARAVVRAGFGRWRSPLFGFDKVSTALKKFVSRVEK